MATKKNIVVKNNHFTISKVDGKEVWEFHWAKIEKDVAKAVKDYEKSLKGKK